MINTHFADFQQKTIFEMESSYSYTRDMIVQTIPKIILPLRMAELNSTACPYNVSNTAV
jgi:hypothetical protein